MLKIARSILCCPDCHEDLQWNIHEASERRIVHADATCNGCSRNYTVRKDIAFFLLDASSHDDLWKVVDSQLARALKENPEYEERLMNSDLSMLNPADKFLRASILDERGHYELARTIREQASEQLYTPSYNEQYGAKKKELEMLLGQEEGMIIDLASGMAGLAELFSDLGNPTVFSDVSPSILFKNRMRLQYFGLYDNASLMAFDVKSMPFRDRSVSVFTSNIGLTNIRNSRSFVKELSRCLKGRAYFIAFFFPDNEDANADLLNQMDMDLAFQDRLEETAGEYLDVDILAPVSAELKPTVKSEIFNIGIDALPVEPTTITWAIVKFKPKSR